MMIHICVSLCRCVYNLSVYIETISLENFRNYKNFTFTLPKGIIHLHGENRSGKTSFIESIYVLSTMTPFHTSRLTDVISLDNDYAHVTGNIKTIKSEALLDITMTTRGERVFKNFNKKITPLYKGVGMLKTVFLSPLDIDIIFGPPSTRRSFVNRSLGVEDPVYMYYLKQYNHVLKQRNILLKGIFPQNSDQIELWNIPLARAGWEIILKREKFIERLNKLIEEYYIKIGKRDEIVSIDYVSSFPRKIQSVKEYEDILRKYQTEDARQNSTRFGPHRDDFKFNLNDKPFRDFGSFGQSRLFVIFLKLASWEFIKLNTNDSPVLLLDDVFIEIDSSRQTQLMNLIKSMDIEQIVITGTVPVEYLPMEHRFNIKLNDNGTPVFINQSQT